MDCLVTYGEYFDVVCVLLIQTGDPAVKARLSLNPLHYDDVITGAMAYQITSLMIGYSTVYSDADERKHQSSASLAFVRGIHRWPMNSPHKWPVKRKMSPFDAVIMESEKVANHYSNQWWPSLSRHICGASGETSSNGPICRTNT